MNLRHARMLELLGGKREVIPSTEVEPEDFDFDGNLNSES